MRAVKDARQPDRLLFIDLPAACGFAAFEASGKIDPRQVEDYFTRLKQAFSELQRAYPQLLAQVQRLVLVAFKQEGALGRARKEIEHDARHVLNIAVDQKLKAFLLRATDASTEDATWLESIATLLAGKPPTHWDDQDRARFEVQLAATARTFEHFRVLAFEMAQSGSALLDGDPRHAADQRHRPRRTGTGAGRAGSARCSGSGPTEPKTYWCRCSKTRNCWTKRT